jgi:hypothetical protein
VNKQLKYDIADLLISMSRCCPNCLMFAFGKRGAKATTLYKKIAEVCKPLGFDVKEVQKGKKTILQGVEIVKKKPAKKKLKGE